MLKVKKKFTTNANALGNLLHNLILVDTSRATSISVFQGFCSWERESIRLEKKVFFFLIVVSFFLLKKIN